jgi:outer membrane receptor protein involved in Fe transport
MSSGRLFRRFSRKEERLRRNTEQGKNASPCNLLKRALLLVMSVVAITTFADLSAVAQQAVRPQLQRVDIDPPEQRARSREASPSYEDPGPYDQTSSDASSATGQTGFGTGAGLPFSSLITDKSAISMRSAALPAQVQTVTRQEIERFPVRTLGDLFRTVPGVRVHSQGRGDVGETMQIRGNSGQHGLDTAIYVDGVPQNFSSTWGIGNGGADVAWLTPEMIDRIEVIKGPFSALYGNHAQAAVINIITRNSDPSPSLVVSGGSFGAFRAVPVISSDSWVPTPFLVNEYQTIDGYRENSFYRRFSSFSKVTVPIWDGNLSARFNYYESNWGTANYPLMGQVRSGVWPRRRALSPDEGGDVGRWSAVLSYSPIQMTGGLYFTSYVESYKRELGWTWLPTMREAISPYDTLTYGGRVFYNFMFGNFASLAVGMEGRYDNAVAQQFEVKNRERVSTITDLDMKISNTALFAQAEIKPVEQVKIVGGVRKDFFQFSVENMLIPANSGIGRPHTFNPKIGIVLTPIKNINIFGNKGIGFHTPAAQEMSPHSTTGKKRFDLSVYKTESWDLGFNATFLDSIYIAFDWYQTDMEGEVRTISNQPVNIGNSQRNGFEVEARYYPSAVMNLFANYAWVDAKVKNPTTAGQDLVTGVAKYVIKGGMEFTFSLPQDIKLLGSLYVEYIGDQPFYFGKNPVPQYPPTYVIYPMKVACEGRHWSAFISAIYQPQEFSSNRIGTAQDSAGKYDFTFTPEPMWDLTSGLKYTF